MMSKKCENEENCPLKNGSFVSELLCQARREAILEKIEGLKKTIYVSSAAVGIVLTAVNLILALAGR